MSGDETSALRHGGVGSINAQGDEKHRVREIFGIEGDDEERHLAIWVVLSVRVCKSQTEGLQENVRFEEEACDQLGLVSKGSP